jgi:hypothetical protein
MYVSLRQFPLSPSHSLQVDLDGSETIAVLKAKIQESQGHPVAVQKIIYSGVLHTRLIDSCLMPLQAKFSQTTRP